MIFFRFLSYTSACHRSIRLWIECIIFYSCSLALLFLFSFTLRTWTLAAFLLLLLLYLFHFTIFRLFMPGIHRYAFVPSLFASSYLNQFICWLQIATDKENVWVCAQAATATACTTSFWTVLIWAHGIYWNSWKLNEIDCRCDSPSDTDLNSATMHIQFVRLKSSVSIQMTINRTRSKCFPWLSPEEHTLHHVFCQSVPEKPYTTTTMVWKIFTIFSYLLAHCWLQTQRLMHFNFMLKMSKQSCNLKLMVNKFIILQKRGVEKERIQYLAYKDTPYHIAGEYVKKIKTNWMLLLFRSLLSSFDCIWSLTSLARTHDRIQV